MRKIMMWSVWLWFAFAAQGASAAEIDIKQFQAGDVISAADVNSNFKTLTEAVQQLQKQMLELQKQNKALIEENRTLKNSLAKTQTKTAEPEKQANSAVSKSTFKTPKYHLRSEPKTVSETEALFLFNPHTIRYIENDFDVKGDVVIDHATGLIWQQSGSGAINYKTAQQYIEYLNQNRFSGYSDWRLPTIEELLSLVEQKKSEDMYIDSRFDLTQRWGWSSDKLSSGGILYISFANVQVNWDKVHATNFVRAVRSIRP